MRNLEGDRKMTVEQGSVLVVDDEENVRNLIQRILAEVDQLAAVLRYSLATGILDCPWKCHFVHCPSSGSRCFSKRVYKNNRNG